MSGSPTATRRYLHSTSFPPSPSPFSLSLAVLSPLTVPPRRYARCPFDADRMQIVMEQEQLADTATNPAATQAWDPRGNCSNMIDSLHLQVLTARLGDVKNPQEKIIGARVTYGSAIWLAVNTIPYSLHPDHRSPILGTNGRFQAGKRALWLAVSVFCCRSLWLAVSVFCCRCDGVAKVFSAFVLGFVRYACACAI